MLFVKKSENLKIYINKGTEYTTECITLKAHHFLS